MFSALFYLQVQSVRNRLWQRLRRLRNPRYLFGALFGVLYLSTFFSRSFFALGRGAHTTGSIVPLETWEFVSALALLGAFVLIWIVPHARAALVFSEAEIAFLFPAPIRRQTLIHFKLVRSQTAVLFTVLFLTLFRGWTGGLTGALMRAAGYWILLSTINLHIIGSSFARTLLLERGMTSWQRRLLVLALLGGTLGVAVLWTGRALPPPPTGGALGFTTLTVYLGQIAQLQPMAALLTPPALDRASLSRLGPRAGVLVVAGTCAVRAGVALSMGGEVRRGVRGSEPRRVAAPRRPRRRHARGTRTPRPSPPPSARAVPIVADRAAGRRAAVEKPAFRRATF